MSVSYTVKLPDGNEYGPVDLGTLRSWHEEGRIGPDTWVWPEGSPEWLTLMDVLAGAGQDGPGEETPLRFKEEPGQPTAAAAAPRATASKRPRPKSAPEPPKRRLAPIFIAIGAVVVIAVAASMVVLVPRLEKQRTSTQMNADAAGETRFRDESVGVSVELPAGWLLLRPESKLFMAPQARARFAHPAVGAYAALTVENVPPGVLHLDAYIDRVVELRRALISDYRDLGRAEATVGGKPARRLQASWVEDRVLQKATVVAAQDAWAYVSLTAWAPAKGGEPAQQALGALAASLQLSGTLGARVTEAAEALAPELPELSRASLELILRDRLGSGGTPDEVADVAVRAASQGLAALTPDEAAELKQVYAQVYDPMAEADRQRLAAWQREVRAGRKVISDEALAARIMLRDALAALPEEARLRLQALNEKAIAAAYALQGP
jgi:hypothetical protein